MLLERLTAYARENRDGFPAFHRDREFRWKLDVSTDSDGRLLGAPRIERLRDPDTPIRGVLHAVPSSTRTVGIAPHLAADDAQYVLGWFDDTTNPDRAAACHGAFVQLIGQWARSVPADIDPVPHVLAELYRSGAVAQLQQPEDLRAKDGVLVSINGEPAYTSPSVAEFWRRCVETRKGSGRTGICMVCRQLRPLANTIPGKVPATLVPGASNDAALVSINERVFGYDLVAQLTHTPICLSCADDLMVGLTGVLSSGHTRTSPGQDTRLAWWVTGTDEPDRMDLVLDPDPAEVDALLAAVHSAQERTDRLTGRFCWLAVAGNVARIMVREWVDIALATEDPDAVSHDTNVLAWFRDHKNTPRYPAPARLRDGTELPAGRWCHSPIALAACLGRWDPATNRYRSFGTKNADRPDQALHQLLRVVVLAEPVAVALNAHLIHRIRSDGHLDDLRASLIRLALTRDPRRRKDTPIPMALDDTRTDPAYLSGRLLCVLEETQRAAHRRPRPRPGSSGDGAPAEVGEGAEPARGEVNSTFGDRFFRRAVDTPRPVLLQGIKESAAWLTKIRRRDGDGRYLFHKNRISDIYGKFDNNSPLFPMRNTLRQQNEFALGYHHQRAHRTPTKTDTDQA